MGRKRGEGGERSGSASRGRITVAAAATLTARLALTPAAAPAHQGARPATAGGISIAAGGAGGPAPATSVSLIEDLAGPTGVSCAGGRLSTGGEFLVRAGTSYGQAMTARTSTLRRAPAPRASPATAARLPRLS